jgi:hypothetical protein
MYQVLWERPGLKSTLKILRDYFIGPDKKKRALARTEWKSVVREVNGKFKGQ